VKPFVAGILAAVFVLAGGAAGHRTLAAWTTGASGPAAAGATTMPAGAQPVGGATNGAVSIRWPAVAMSNGVAVAGYVVRRFDAASGAEATVGAACSGVITTTTCTEQSVPVGMWIYTVTPVQLSWSGAQSPPSSPITVS